MVVIQQHEHPLTRIDLNPKYPHDEHVYDDEKDLISNQLFEHSCGRCDQKITFYHRYYYKCDQCEYTLHELCSKLPITLEHASHLAHTLALFLSESREKCHVCKCTIWDKQLCYYCSQCMLNICLDCVDKVKHHTIYHPSHKHPLVPTSRQILVNCDACGKEHKGVFYLCTTCFCSFIHEDCVFHPKRLLIQESTCDKIFHTHPLILTYGFLKEDQQAKYYPRCRVCDKSFSGYEKLWIYKCEKCYYYVHLECAYLRSEHSQLGVQRITSGNDVDDLHIPLSDDDRTYNSCHKHPIIRVDAQSNDIATRNKNDALCNACLISITENMTFYKCNDRGCNFVLHDWCTQFPAELKDYKGHREHTLVLLPKSDHEYFLFWCIACTRLCNGFAYACVKCEYYIDLHCAFIPRKITHESHQYYQIFRAEPYNSREAHCRMCSGFQVDEFSSSPQRCDVHQNLWCALFLPETISHRYDKHPLSLTYSPVKNYGGDYFCEICEEELYPNVGFYHCYECAQSIHTTCAQLIPQSKPLVYDSLNPRKHIKYGGTHKTKDHPHPLTFLLGTESDDCSRCGGSLSHFLIYKCLECKFAIHYDHA